MTVDHRENAFKVAIEHHLTTTGVYVASDRHLCRKPDAVLACKAATGEAAIREGNN